MVIRKLLLSLPVKYDTEIPSHERSRLMAVSYKRLFHLLIEKEMTNTQLQQKAGFSANIITRLKRNETISMESLEAICKALECSVDDILEFTPEKSE